MKKIFCISLTLILVFALAACGQKEENISDSSDNPPMSSSSQPSLDSENTNNTEVNTPITLTIGDMVLEAYLNDSVPAQSLIEQLPLTISLNDSDNDFCGGNLDIDYSESDVTSGYQNGDLMFWTPANNFVIFVNGEENSTDTGDLVKLGHIISSQEMLDTLDGNIDVTIALKAEANADIEKTESFVFDDEESSKTNTNESEVSQMKVKITVGDTELIATLENNATTQALLDQMPMTLPMMDLYGREMCYRYGAYALPTDNLRSDGYEIGDIAYWAPGGSLVILYAQNGEQFERQHLGHIDSGVEIFENTGDVDVTFEKISD